MNKISRTVLVDGYQPTAPKSGTRVSKDPKTGRAMSAGPKKLPKATSAIKPAQKR